MDSFNGLTASHWQELTALNLPEKYEDVRLTPIKTYDWGWECFVHDLSVILFHFGEFYR